MNPWPSCLLALVLDALNGEGCNVEDPRGGKREEKGEKVPVQSSSGPIHGELETLGYLFSFLGGGFQGAQPIMTEASTHIPGPARRMGRRVDLHFGGASLSTRSARQPTPSKSNLISAFFRWNKSSSPFPPSLHDSSANLPKLEHRQILLRCRYRLNRCI